MVFKSFAEVPGPDLDIQIAQRYFWTADRVHYKSGCCISYQQSALTMGKKLYATAFPWVNRRRITVIFLFDDLAKKLEAEYAWPKSLELGKLHAACLGQLSKCLFERHKAIKGDEEIYAYAVQTDKWGDEAQEAWDHLKATLDAKPDE